MTIEIDGEEIELDEESGVFIRSICLLINKTPAQLALELLKEYESQVKKDMARSDVH